MVWRVALRASDILFRNKSVFVRAKSHEQRVVPHDRALPTAYPVPRFKRGHGLAVRVLDVPRPAASGRSPAPEGGNALAPAIA